MFLTCQEGIQLVLNPLPVYPHVKTIRSDAEGMEVAQLLGAGNALLLLGHGVHLPAPQPSSSIPRSFGARKPRSIG